MFGLVGEDIFWYCLDLRTSDSLCIIQVLEEDKAVEIARVRNIFQYSNITISAAAASKANEGFLYRTITESQYIELPFHVLMAAKAPFCSGRSQLTLITSLRWIQ